jgi:hypothetical protein
MHTKQIVVAGQQIALNSRDGALNDKGTLVGARRFMAAKAGLTDDLKEMKTSEVVALIESRGLATKDQCKVWDKEYKAHRNAHFAASSQIGGLFIASPEWRKSFKPAYNAKGEFIGGNLSIRRERSSTASLASQLAAARAEIAALKSGSTVPAIA